MHGHSSRVPSDATCLDCGYRLLGNKSGKCPECGREFHPGDSSTFATPALGSSWRKWAVPPTNGECLWTAVFGLYTLYCASCPSSYPCGRGAIGAMICSAPIWIPLLVAYLVRRFASSKAAALDSDEPTASKSESRSGRWRWRLLPFFVVLVLTSLVHPWPLVLRFEISRSAFDAAYADARSGQFRGSRRVGLYHASLIFLADGGASLRSGSVSFSSGYPGPPPDETGFQRDPMGVLPSSGPVFDLGGGWTTYSR